MSHRTGWEWESANQSSSALYERALRVVPGGSMTRSKRVFRRYASHAEGAIVWDTDGKEYIDTMCALGAISLGYRPPPAEGGVYSFPHHVEIDAAEAVLQHVAPWASWVRFTKTGSEATHAAYRIAKAHDPRRIEAIDELQCREVGRDVILIGSSAYHGWHEWCSFPPSCGINTFPEHWNYTQCINPQRVAAVVIEPPRFTALDPEWLRGIRAWCDEIGALLVFDSMIWGGRHALGGASQFYSVTPDLECFGKAMANGQAISFVVGTDRTREHGEIPSGTFSGETSGLTALLSTLHTYTTEPVIETLWARGRQLQDGLRDVIPSHLGACEGEPVCQRVRFFNEAHGQQFSDAMLDRGIIWHPLVAMPMYAHTEAQIFRVIQAAKDSICELERAA